MPETIAIGTVPYLNAWPLTEGLAQCAEVELRVALPCALGPMLKRGEVQVALVPAIEYFRLSAEGGERARPDAPAGYVALGVGAIGSRGAVGSVRLFGYAEPDCVRRVLLDPASRTSNAMARLVLARRFGVRPHFVFPDEADRPGTRPPDAELIMGDRGLTAERPEARWVLDLGAAWERLVHRPFVYAPWVARADAPVDRLAEVLSAARDRGLGSLEALAARGAAALGLPVETARRYLLEQMHYAFGPKEQSGLRVFYRMAVAEGLVPENVLLRMAPGAGETA